MDCINQLGWEDMEALVRAARHLSMPHLMNACLNHLKSQVNVGNAATLYELAMQCGGTALAQYCFKVSQSKQASKLGGCLAAGKCALNLVDFNLPEFLFSDHV